MPTQPIAPKESFANLEFPKGGIDLSMAFSRQQPRQAPMPPSVGYATVAAQGASANAEGVEIAQLQSGLQGVERKTGSSPYYRTTPAAINVRAYEPASGRARGGSRAGLKAYIPSPLVAGWIVQNVNYIVGDTVPGGGPMPQTSSSGRVVTVLAVSQGNIYFANSGDTTWNATTNNTGRTPPLNFTGIVYSASNNQVQWFVDGLHFVKYTPATNIVANWTASAGALPIDSSNNAPRLICTWRGRIVLSGLILDPQNWFMSAVTDPTNFDYSPASTTPTQAVAGNNSPLGTVGDVLTALIPYTDDVLVFGGDHTIWYMNGDPLNGGQIDLISDSIGMAWGMAWCKDPYGNLYFVSNKTGIYTLVPGQAPQRISQGIEQLLANVDTGANTILMQWDDRNQGCHVFITPTAGAAPATHLFYEQRTGAWFQDQFANPNHNPLTCCTFDGNLPGDRIPLIGSWDGFVRSIDPTVTTDDGWPISSSVVLGPLLTADGDEVVLKQIQAVMGATSGTVTWQVFVGPTAEIALASTPIMQGTWGAGRNPNSFSRWAGHAIYVKLSSSQPWSMEFLRATIAGTGKVRRRAQYV